MEMEMLWKIFQQLCKHHQIVSESKKQLSFFNYEILTLSKFFPLAAAAVDGGRTNVSGAFCGTCVTHYCDQFGWSCTTSESNSGKSYKCSCAYQVIGNVSDMKIGCETDCGNVNRTKTFECVGLHCDC